LAMTPKFKNVKFLDLGPIGISSTEIRKRIKEKKSVRYLLPKNVMDYIFQHHLYE
ncbi:TPA: nicotinic acid mononucleotide adenylyltransferase, partial [bacterium]|nr:nicotinic acid mononucleotide adenylyltransferase [bacterium]